MASSKQVGARAASCSARPQAAQLLGLLLALLLSQSSAGPRRQPPSSSLPGEERSDGCERVRRGAMLCTLCREAESGARYERCSYAPAAQPRQQRLTYRYPGYSSSGSQEDEASAHSDSAQEAEEAEEARPRGCSTLHSDHGESCTVCTDPDTRAKSERCDYAFRPKDKAYAYSKSKSFGYPRSGSSGQRSAEAASASLESDSSSASAESQRTSERLRASEDDCREEKRASMLCRVCKHPGGGDESEQCSYSREPDDEHFAYSKSKSFADYRPDSEEPQESRPRGSQHEAKEAAKKENKSSAVDGGFQDASLRRAEIEKIVAGMRSAKRPDCSKSYRNGMTCYSCRDREGLSDEECVFLSDDEAAAASRPRRQTGSANDRPLYDKLLGLGLPAHMLERSASERDSDRSFEH